MTEDIIQNTEEELTEDENGQLYEHLRIVVDKGQVPLRIDKFMCEHLQKPYTESCRFGLCTCKRETGKEQL